MTDRYQQVMLPCALCESTEFSLVQSYGRIVGPGVYGELPVRACNRCGFLMLNPRYEDRFYQDYYRTLYRSVATGERVPTPEYLHRQAERGGKILRFLNDRFRLGRLPPGRLLDVGCSSGATMVPFRDAGWKVFGIDPDPACVEHGRRALGLPVQVGEAEQLAFPDRSFDLVLNLGTLEHAYDLRRAFQGCRRVLEDSGLLFLQYRSTTMWGSPLEYFNHNHACYFSERTLRLALRAFGFEPLEFLQEQLEGIPGMHYVVARPAEPAGRESLLRSIQGGLRDDPRQILAGLQAYERGFAERARAFLALVERHRADPEAILAGLQAGEVNYQVLDGPREEAVRRGIAEARGLLQFMDAGAGSNVR